MNKQKNVLIGVSGGIAAYKMPEVAKQLTEKNIVNTAILTRSAEHFVSIEDFLHAGSQHVYTDLFVEPVEKEKILATRVVEHIAIAKQADIFIVAPATADIIAKLAMGIADDYLTTVALALTCPIIIFPSMNTYMWMNPATQENVRTLQQRGMRVVTPGVGKLACGDEGAGRLPEVSEIVSHIIALLHKRDEFAGKKVIVTFGGTREYIDDVRFITNLSSGKMGAAIADALFLRGADVSVLRSVDAGYPRFVESEETFETAEQLDLLCKEYCPRADMVIHAAAVSDFTVAKTKGKISSENSLTLSLIPSVKILNNIKKYNPTIKLIGFKAVWNVSHQELLKQTKDILQKSGADSIVANDVGRENQGFASDHNEVLIMSKNGSTREIPYASKSVVAEGIVDFIIHI